MSEGDNSTEKVKQIIDSQFVDKTRIKEDAAEQFAAEKDGQSTRRLVTAWQNRHSIFVKMSLQFLKGGLKYTRNSPVTGIAKYQCCLA